MRDEYPTRPFLRLRESLPALDERPDTTGFQESLETVAAIVALGMEHLDEIGNHEAFRLAHKFCIPDICLYFVEGDEPAVEGRREAAAGDVSRRISRGMVCRPTRLPARVMPICASRV